MSIDPRALENAATVMETILRAEADAQHAYLAKVADGRISLELEALDLHAIVQQVVAAYVASSRRP